ncbi:unnamed protein product [Alopecurus aequalis]
MKITREAAVLVLPCLCAVVCLMAQMGAATVLLMANNLTLSFNDFEAKFAPGVNGSGVNGVFYTAEPLNACNTLTNKAVKGPPSPFALVIRGACTFDEKVKNVQDAGFKAAIVYDNENSKVLVSMSGNSSGIHIYAVFISKVSGEVLKFYSGSTDVAVWIIPTFENSAWSIMAISFMSLLPMSAVLAFCFVVRRHGIGSDRPRNQEDREFHGVSSQLVKAMSSLVFTEVQEDNCMSSSTMCAICLEDYTVGEKLRVLPCHHKFHAACVDLWLTSWRSFCPVCKRDTGAGISAPPGSETTPLYSSSSSSVHLPSPSSSFRSSVGASPPRNTSAMSISRSSANLGSVVSNISYAPYGSIYGSPSLHLSSSYVSNYGYVSSSSDQYYLAGASYLRHRGDSDASLSAMTDGD